MKQIKVIFILLCFTFLVGCNTKDKASTGTISKSTDYIAPKPASAAPTVKPLFIFPAPDVILLSSAPAASVAPTADKNTVTDEKLDITLYIYGPDDYDNPIEKKIIQVSKVLYETDLPQALNLIFAETDIRFNSAKVDPTSKCITVDIPQEVADKFNAGSCAGIILMNELTNTLLNLPDINSAVVTVDGIKDTYADHYSFEGIFTKEKELG
ncbi:hypothetical protein Ana3638_08200 [Anaerocolumna sedimenticola]|uniref:GerMN domain-containing protein n=1 Tax=Anaerocolumna sedimenticola TaxID=2696063 RepID=A0A6P1TM57_9FIRM|nr:hypothetical protein [Anaerocolumna sedimenticola]QHQ60755.1 hypothetical protein Ana3638_08200 [Anaerocolumna sedimenticola]